MKTSRTGFKLYDTNSENTIPLTQGNTVNDETVDENMDEDDSEESLDFRTKKKPKSRKRKRRKKKKKKVIYITASSSSSSSSSSSEEEEEEEGKEKEKERERESKKNHHHPVIKKRRKSSRQSANDNTLNARFIGSSNYIDMVNIIENQKDGTGRGGQGVSTYIIRKINEYVQFVRRDEVKFARLIAGLTSHNLGYVLMDVPDIDISGYLGGHSREKALDTNIIFYNYDIIKDLKKEGTEIEKILDVIDKRLTTERRNDFKVILNRNNTRGLNDNGEEPEYNSDEETVKDYVYKTSLGERSKTFQVKSRIGASSSSGSGVDMDGLLSQVKHRFKKIDQLLHEKRRPKTRRVKRPELDLFENIGKRISSDLKYNLSNRDNVSGFGRIGSNMSTEKYTEIGEDEELVKSTVKSVLNEELDSLTDQRSINKVKLYSALNLKIRYQDFYEAHLNDALDDVRRAIGSNEIKIKHLIKNIYTFTKFGKLVAAKMKGERFDKSTRDPGGKYHAESVYTERYAEPEFYQFEWFKNNIAFERGQIVLKRKLKTDRGRRGNNFNGGAVGFLMNQYTKKKR